MDEPQVIPQRKPPMPEAELLPTPVGKPDATPTAVLPPRPERGISVPPTPLAEEPVKKRTEIKLETEMMAKLDRLQSVSTAYWDVFGSRDKAFVREQNKQYDLNKTTRSKDQDLKELGELKEEFTAIYAAAKKGEPFDAEKFAVACKKFEAISQNVYTGPLGKQSAGVNSFVYGFGKKLPNDGLENVYVTFANGQTVNVMQLPRGSDGNIGANVVKDAVSFTRYENGKPVATINRDDAYFTVSVLPYVDKIGDRTKQWLSNNNAKLFSDFRRDLQGELRIVTMENKPEPVKPVAVKPPAPPGEGQPAPMPLVGQTGGTAAPGPVAQVGVESIPAANLKIGEKQLETQSRLAELATGKSLVDGLTVSKSSTQRLLVPRSDSKMFIDVPVYKLEAEGRTLYLRQRPQFDSVKPEVKGLSIQISDYPFEEGKYHQYPRGKIEPEKTFNEFLATVLVDHSTERKTADGKGLKDPAFTLSAVKNLKGFLGDFIKSQKLFEFLESLD